MRDFTRFFLRNRALSWLLQGLVLAGGLFAYMNMGKLEDAPFTIKQALVTTSYPGASPMEVREQVTDILEEAIQSLGELYYLKSDNRAGLSKITVYVKKEIRAEDMQQLWDKLRRKVGDAQSKLPAGACPSVVNDDFGDVLGVFYSLSSPTRTYREMEDQAKALKNDLLGIQDVAKVELFGLQNRTIEVTVNPALLSRSGVTLTDIASAFERQNRIVDAGAIETSTNRLRVEAAGSFGSLEEIENLTVISRAGDYFRLGDLARIEESYARPPRSRMTVGGQPAVDIAISTVADGNVVEMARRVADYIDQARKDMPEGYNLDIIYDQGHESAVANEGFILNLILSVLTVVIVLLLFIGLKNGFLIGSGLVFSIFGTLIYMQATGIALQRMSLAAIIIAMGMLVDNAIVVYDAALVNMQRGARKRTAILDAVTSTAMPLLGATLIAVLTFLPIYLSPHITGELLSSLFIVIAVSLLLSWVLAITQNVFFVQEFVRRPRPEELKGELFSGRAYDLFRRALAAAIRWRYVILAGMVVALLVAGWGFRFIPRQFMPLLNKQYFSIDMWLPEGTRFEECERQAAELTDLLREYEGVKKVSTFVGQTPPRYYLANAAYGPQPNYAQCLVETETPERSAELRTILYDQLPNTRSSGPTTASCRWPPNATSSEAIRWRRSTRKSARRSSACACPEGYTFFWDSQYKDQKEAMAALTKYFSLAFILLVVILVALFGNFRQPLIILLILPLSLIGMVFGLWLTGFQFGFFCIAGWLGLLGMIIKNVIVLLDEINVQRRSGRDPYTAVIEATVSRIRPVLMAALTTVFGSIPLLFDIVFGGMAATIVFGLSFATLLTLFVTPALYTILYGVGKRAETSSNLSK